MTNISTDNIRIYYTDTYLDKLEAKILEVGQDVNGSYVIFDKTIFHPQGGGQPVDEGYLKIDSKCFAVTKLVAPRNPHEEPYLIKHYYKGEGDFLKGEKVCQVIDMKKRLLYSRLHSAGHLIEDAVKQIFPSLKGIRGNHFPDGQAFVVFAGGILSDIQQSKEKIFKLVNELAKRDLVIKTKHDNEIRTVQIGDFSCHPCGGTHVNNTSEIGEIIIRNIKKDKDDKSNLRIGYDVMLCFKKSMPCK